MPRTRHMAKTPKVSLRVFTGSEYAISPAFGHVETRAGGYESCIAPRCKLTFRNT